MQTMEARNHYKTEGYVVCQNLVPVELIDKLLNLYKQQIVPSEEKFLRQMTNQHELNDPNEFGYVKQDFLDVHNYEKFPEFSTSVKEILCSDAIQNTLKEITGYNSFRWMQSLLFDANRETIPHHDSYYLDTVPAGHLTAVWIALEDIDERAGRFYVIPKSTNDVVYNLPHPQWLAKMQEYFDSNLDKIVAPALSKGDALFWNSEIIHGALPTGDQRFSRKSLTGHFVPTEYKYGNLFFTKEYVEHETYKGVKIHSATVPKTSEWKIIGDYKVGA